MGKGSGKREFSRGGRIETARFQGARRHEIPCTVYWINFKVGPRTTKECGTKGLAGAQLTLTA